MTREKELEVVIEKFSPLQQRAIKEVLEPLGLIALKGKKLFIRLSEITSLPDTFPTLYYNIERMSTIVAMENNTPMTEYSGTSISMKMESIGVGKLEGYSLDIHSAQIDQTKYMPHPVFGQQYVELNGVNSHTFGASTVPKGNKYEIAVWSAHPKIYLFLLFYPTTNSDILKRAKKTAFSQRITLVDYEVQKEKPISDIKKKANAVIWIEQLDKSQLTLLKQKLLNSVNLGATLERQKLNVAVKKEDMEAAMLVLCEKHFELILGFQEEIGSVEIPAEKVAKTLILDAFDTGVLEEMENVGIFVSLKHEHEFDGILPKTEIGKGSMRLQFYGYASLKDVTGYLATNANSGPVKTLQKIVDAEIPKHDGTRKIPFRWSQTAKVNGTFVNKK